MKMSSIGISNTYGTELSTAMTLPRPEFGDYYTIKMDFSTKCKCCGQELPENQRPKNPTSFTVSINVKNEESKRRIQELNRKFRRIG
jgi:hypothetical protein